MDNNFNAENISSPQSSGRNETKQNHQWHDQRPMTRSLAQDTKFRVNNSMLHRSPESRARKSHKKSSTRPRRRSRSQTQTSSNERERPPRRTVEQPRPPSNEARRREQEGENLLLQSVAGQSSPERPPVRRRRLFQRVAVNNGAGSSGQRQGPAPPNINPGIWLPSLMKYLIAVAAAFPESDPEDLEQVSQRTWTSFQQMALLMPHGRAREIWGEVLYDFEQLLKERNPRMTFAPLGRRCVIAQLVFTLKTKLTRELLPGYSLPTWPSFRHMIGFQSTLTQ